MHLCKHTIWPGSYLEQTKLEIKHLSGFGKMFPNYNNNALQTTLNSPNESSTITINYINQEGKLRKVSTEFSKIKTKKL
jgi:hypothetical protein